MSDERSQSDTPRGGGGKSAKSAGGGGKRPSAKRRRKAPAKPKPPPAKAAAGRQTEAAESAGDAAAEEAAAPPQRAETATLPAYGLAADVLADHGRAAAAEDSGALDVDLDDADRIFGFADQLAARSESEAEPEVPTRITTWVTFGLAGEVFALPVEPVREVLRVTSITRVPHAPAPIRGVSNVRGRVIPVIDLRLRIGLEAADIERASRVLVVRSRGRLLGLLVDAVHQVVHLDLNLVQPPPEDVMTLQSDYISGVYHLGEQLVLLLDVERALLLREVEEGDVRTPAEDTGKRDSPGSPRPTV